MEQKRQEHKGMEGRLPASAPLANPYVPFQLEDPPKYEARTGLVRGTLFPGLDLPFMNMVNQKELPITPKTELQVLAFAVNELALYLDTHPNDTEALEMYETYQQVLRMYFTASTIKLEQVASYRLVVIRKLWVATKVTASA